MSAECERAFTHILKVISQGKEEGIVGLGSGSTVAPLAKLLNDLPIGFRVVPTSRQAQQLILEHCPGRFVPLEAVNGQVLITVDGADAIDLKRGIVIKGGGGCHVQEKIVAQASTHYCLVIHDSSKLSQDLSGIPVPVEVIPCAASLILGRLARIFPAGSFSIRQSGKGKAGPVVTDNGNLIIDAKFENERFDEVEKLMLQLKDIAGVVDTGIFLVPSGTIIFEGRENQYLINRE